MDNPPLSVSIFNNETIECDLEFYRNSHVGGQEKYYTIKLTNTNIKNISSHYPNSLTHSDSQSH
ncbi:type VI secretion system tube protein Hcp [Proteus mirabilis]|uniref:type VI secretion system tube protein Hcp n=1 Tax=Proteus mirabilis TaxID=584 RepID=UPI0028806FD9|nr:type VI secretion system tube protein Hcp [Proteus mirabilis]MEC3991931.1 type VI secretion system tube protein Hcp [Proteus mirabilis]MEC4068808.1 type VI secretion system tube protein Hcp [Proteus mirabilis]MEC4099071.1 type VI secretion system tube protein Hcp [Proteus mirabilis]